MNVVGRLLVDVGKSFVGMSIFYLERSMSNLEFGLLVVSFILLFGIASFYWDYMRKDENSK